MPNFTIGLKNADHLAVRAVSVPHADSGDSYNNISVEIYIKAGGFTGCYEAWFDLQDFIRLRAGFHLLYTSLSASVKFETMEGQLEFEVVGDGRGHFEIRGVAGDTDFVSNQLRFFLEIDQSYIPAIIQDLDGIIKQNAI
jgi:hypothetical protein